MIPKQHYPELHHAITSLARVCDGARSDDTAGFNGRDTHFGHSLASQHEWSEKQALAAYKMLRTYRNTQLPSFGIDYDKLPKPKKVEKKESPRKVVLDGKRIVFVFEYDPEIISAVKEIPGRKFDGKTKTWSVPLGPGTLDSVRDFAKEHRFEMDPDLSEMIEKFDAEFEIRRTLSDAEGSDLPPLEVEKELNGTLRPFQRAGIAYAIRAKRCFIADEMGLGKTLQSIAATHHLKAYPVVTVVPACVKIKWAREWERWFDGLRVQVLEGQSPEKIEDCDVVVINYDILQHWADELKALNPQAWIFDESHYLKNHKTIRFKTAKALTKKAEVIYLLTGTPIENGVMEFSTQLQIIRRLNDFGGFWPFAFRYAAARKGRFGWEFGSSNLEELNEKLRSIGYVRRLKMNVAKDLPSKTRAVEKIDIDNWSEYRRAEDQFLAWIADRAIDDEFMESLDGLDPDEKLSEISRERAAAAARAASAEMLVKLGKLKQLAAEGKFSSAIEWIDNFVQSGEKLIVFGWHRDLVEKLAHHYKAPKIIGGMSADERQKNADAFMNDPKVKLIFCNLRAAGVGVDLYAASNVLFLELGWTPTIHDQAEARAHRIGQTKPVTAWYLLSERTIEDDIYNLIEAKRAVVEQATDGNGSSPQKSIIRSLVDRMMENAEVTA